MLALLALSLTGCSMHFVHPTKNEADFKHDFTDCQVKLNQAGYGKEMGFVQNRFLQNCLEGEGWQRDNS